MNERLIQIPMMSRLAPVTVRAEGQTKVYQCVFSVGAQVRRYDWWKEEYWIEELEVSRAAVDLSRLNNGAPLLNSHQRWDLRSVIGVIERAWIEEGKGIAEFRFSAREEVKPINRDVDDGVIRNLSAGYEVLEMKDVGRDEKTGYRIMRATRWAPHELSLVPIGADQDAQLRSHDPDRRVQCRVFLDVDAGGAAGAVKPAPTEVADPKAGAEEGTPKERSNPEPTPGVTIIMDQPKKEEPSAADLERQRTKEIADLGDAYSKYVTQKDIGDAIRNGRTAEQFKDTIMEKMQSRHTDTSALHIGLSGREIQRYSLARAIVASISGDWANAGFERECSRAVEKLVGASPEGFFVPYEAFKRDFNVGTSTEAGNLVETALRSDLYVDALRNAMVLSRMGIRVLAGLSGNVDIPRKSVAGTIGMLSEIGSASETNPQTALLSLRPKRLGAYTEYSKQALIQSAMALEPMLRDDLLLGAAVKMENQVLNGVGSSNEFTGLRVTSGIGTVAVGTNGGALTWGLLVDLESACANSNAEPDRLAGYVTNTRVRGKAKQIQKGTNLPFIWTEGEQPLNGYRAGITNNIPNNLTKGTSTTVCSAALFSSDWSMYVLGLFGAPDITVDPYTKADTGQVRITLNQFADGGLRQPATVAKCEDITTA